MLTFSTENATAPIVHFSALIYTRPAPDSAPALFTTPLYTITCTSGSSASPSPSSSDLHLAHRLSPAPPAHLVAKGDSVDPARGDAGLLPNLELPFGPFLIKGVQAKVGKRVLVEGKAMRVIVTRVYDAVAEKGEE